MLRDKTWYGYYFITKSSFISHLQSTLENRFKNARHVLDHCSFIPTNKQDECNEDYRQKTQKDMTNSEQSQPVAVKVIFLSFNKNLGERIKPEKIFQTPRV